MTVEQIIAGIAGGRSIASVARGLDMSAAVARDMIPDDAKRALVMRLITQGASLFSAARKVGLKSAGALALLGIDDCDSPTPDDLAAEIIARFDRGVPPNKIAYRLELTTTRVNAALSASRPVQLATRMMRGSMSPEAIADLVSPQVIAQAEAIATADRRSCKLGAGRHPRIMLRTADGRATISTDPHQVRAARRMMKRVARGRAWTEGAL